MSYVTDRITICASCEAELQANERGIPTCPYCGRQYRQGVDGFVQELNNIIRLRQKEDFKEAKKGCENLLKTHSDSSEVYWQEILSDFGIVYDYASGKPKLCDRAEEHENSNVSRSIEEDPNYQMVLMYANDDNKRYYISQAKELDSLLKELLHKKKKEETYLQFSKKQKTVRNVILIGLLVAAVIGAIAFGIVKLRDHQMKMESEKRIQETISAIGSIESEISYADLDAIKAAESLYKQLSEEEKSAVSNYTDLVRAREEYEALIAWASANPLTITFDALGGIVSRESMQVTYGKSYAGSNSSLPIAEKQGYRFAGWYSELDGSQVAEQTIVSAKVDHALYAQWSLISYSIRYEGVGGVYDIDTPDNKNPVSYSIESEKILLVSASKKGYDFNGWTDESGVPVTEIPAQSIGDRALIAHWTPITYSISYLGVSGENDIDVPTNTNPISYSIETGAIALLSVSKTGYSFKGWKNETGEIVSVIPEKSIGNLTLIAQWQLINYEITYVLNGGSTTNRHSFTIESDFTLSDPTYSGKDFVGWRENGNGPILKSVSIGKGTTGNKSYTAYWTSTYTVDYTIDGVTDIDGDYYDKPNPDKLAMAEIDERIYDLKIGGVYSENNLQDCYMVNNSSLTMRLSITQNMGSLRYDNTAVVNGTQSSAQGAWLSDDSCSKVSGTNINSKVGYGAVYLRVAYSDGTVVEKNATNIFQNKQKGNTIDLLQVTGWAPNLNKTINRIDITVAYEICVSYGFLGLGRTVTAWRMDQAILFQDN